MFYHLKLIPSCPFAVIWIQITCGIFAQYTQGSSVFTDPFELTDPFHDKMCPLSVKSRRLSVTL